MKAARSKSKTWVEEELWALALYKAEISLDPSSCQPKQIRALLDQKLRNAGKILSEDQIKYLRRKIKPKVTELLQNAELVPPVSDETDGINPYHQELTFSRLESQIRSLELSLGIEPCFVGTVTPGQWTEQNVVEVDRDFATFEAKFPKARYKPPAQSKPKLPTRRRARRKALFAQTQKLWSSNRSRCAKSVLSGQWQEDGGSKCPPETLHQFWKEIFEKPSKADDRTVTPKRNLQWPLLE